MPIVIKAAPDSGFSDPIGLLNDCHRRIEHFLSVLVRVSGEARGGTMTGEMEDAWKRSLDYFRDAAPRHTQDEEESLFPRLEGMDNDQAKQTMQQIATLETDHENAAQWHDEVDRIGRRWLLDRTLPEKDAAHLHETLLRLDDMYRQHIFVEEHKVFPVAAAVLPASELKQMGGEMAKRRGLDFSLTTISQLLPPPAGKP